MEGPIGKKTFIWSRYDDCFRLLVTTLPRTTPEGYQVILIKLINLDWHRFIMQNCFKSLDMEAMLNLHRNGTSPGHIILMDLQGISFSHLPMLNPTYIMKFFFYLQVIYFQIFYIFIRLILFIIYLKEALPFRLKTLCYFNIPSFMDKIMAILKPYLKKDLLNSVSKKFHS